jgi:MarR family transcriptional regulator, organic hydroperoxide resistance regulator
MHQFYTTCAYFTAAKYMRTVEKFTDKIFEPTRLKPAYSYIMMFIQDDDEKKITNIAQALGYDRSSVSRMCQKLVQLGYLTERQFGRSIGFEITNEGEQFLITANECLKQLAQTTDSVLGTEKKGLTSLLVSSTDRLKEVVN